MALLPDLVLLELFSFVSAEEKFGTLRLVCRRWRQVVEFQVQRDLVVYENVHPLKDRWPSDDRQIDLLDTVGQPFFEFCLANGHCKAIKRLFLCGIDLAGFERKGLMPKLLECVCQLEELSVDQTKIAPDVAWGVFQRLNLNGLTLLNLKVLSVKQLFYMKPSIIAPKLKKLVLWDPCFDYLNRGKGLMISVSHPERLSSLQCQQIDKETRAFPNLLQLSARHVKRDFTLSPHRKLKKLDLCLYPRRRLDYSSNFHVTTERLMEQRSELKLDDLEITNFGVKDEVTSSWLGVNNEAATYLGLFDGDLDRLAKNFTIDYLPWRVWCGCSVNRHDLFGELARTRLNIEIVTVGSENEQLDPDLLIKFLVEIGGVKCLTFGRCSLPQEFFDQLPTVSYIGIFSMRNQQQVLTDFGFISSMRFLNQIELSTEKFAFDSFFGAFKRSKIKNLFISIWRCYGRSYHLMLRNNRIRLWSRIKNWNCDFDNLDAALTVFKEKCDREVLI